jgi:hypothetical protein
LNEVNYGEIIFSDPSEWTTEQEKALDTLFQYTYSKPKIDYKNPEDIDRLNETLDDYIYEIISKIPMVDNPEVDIINTLKNEMDVTVDADHSLITLN